MNKKTAKRLQLSSETVLTLSSSLLDHVAGGQAQLPTTQNPLSVIDGCPSRPWTQCVSRTCP